MRASSSKRRALLDGSVSSPNALASSRPPAYSSKRSTTRGSPACGGPARPAAPASRTRRSARPPPIAGSTRARNTGKNTSSQATALPQPRCPPRAAFARRAAAARRRQLDARVARPRARARSCARTAPPSRSAAGSRPAAAAAGEQRLGVVRDRGERAYARYHSTIVNSLRGARRARPRGSTCRPGRCARSPAASRRFIWYSGDVISQVPSPAWRPRRGGSRARATDERGSRPRGTRAPRTSARDARAGCAARASQTSRRARRRHREPPPQARPTRSTYSCVRVSILTMSPMLMNSGTPMVAPVSTVAGLVVPVAVSPRTPGSRLTSRSDEVRQRDVDRALVEEHHRDGGCPSSSRGLADGRLGW